MNSSHVCSWLELADVVGLEQGGEEAALGARVQFLGLGYSSKLLQLQDAVAKDEVESLNITVGTQRRAVLEAVAFGTFLRDVESYVDGEYQLLTPLSSAPKKGGGGRGPSRPPLMGA